MSLQGTRIKETESLYFGLAELYFGDSSTYESSITPVLVESDYLGCLVEVSFVIAKEFIKRYTVHDGFKIISDYFLIGSELNINIELVELTQKNFSYSLGGNGLDSNVLDNLLSQPADLRAELIFTYPNKINSMTLILPKVKVITKSTTFNFTSEEPVIVPVSLLALKSTHTNWSPNPLGKIIFG